MEKCSHCKSNAHDSWPDPDCISGQLCEECWEKYIDGEWWERVLKLNSLQNELIDRAVDKNGGE